MEYLEAMKAAEELALRFAGLVAEERAAEARLAAVRAEKDDALRRLLAFKMNGNGSGPTLDPSAGKEKVFDLLESQPSRVFATGEVGAELGMAANVASAYLSELFLKDRRIARIVKGKYQSFKGAPQLKSIDEGAFDGSTGSTESLTND